MFILAFYHKSQLPQLMDSGKKYSFLFTHYRSTCTTVTLNAAAPAAFHPPKTIHRNFLFCSFNYFLFLFFY